MPRLRPPRMGKPATPLQALLAVLDHIQASKLSPEAKSLGKMLAMDNFLLGRALLSGRRIRHRVPPERDLPKTIEED